MFTYTFQSRNDTDDEDWCPEGEAKQRQQQQQEDGEKDDLFGTLDALMMRAAGRGQQSEPGEKGRGGKRGEGDSCWVGGGVNQCS
jgi:hypothetical protein